MKKWLHRLRQQHRYDDFEPAAADLLRRAKELESAPAAVVIGNDQVVYSIARFVGVLGNASRLANRATNLISGMTILGVVLTGVNVWLVIVQIQDSKRDTAMETSITLNNDFFHNPDNVGIISAIEEKKPILVSNGGRFSSTQLDGYLGDFETIYAAYHGGEITEGDLCSSFSTYLDETLSNDEIKKYLHANAAYFAGVVELGETVRKSKLDNCR